jgi:Gluconate 2-dehydrogenase subunit 3
MLSRVGPLRAATPQSPTHTGFTLKAYVDVLIPADETPSASALDVDKQLQTVAKGKPDYQRLLELGLDWLNARAQSSFGANFPDLNEEKREAVVRQAAAAPYNTLPRVFFERTRADALYFYYSRPESWRGIAYYRGPPQPLGFLDYAERPRKQR